MTTRRAIFRRYALVLSGAVVGTLLAYGAVEIAFATRENLQRTQEFHVSEARALSGRVSFFFEEIERNLVAVASSPWNRGLDASDRMADYQRVMRMLPAIRDVTYADETGRELFFVSRVDPNRVESGRQLDRRTLEGLQPGRVTLRELRRSRASSAPIVEIVLRDPGKAAGVTIMTLNLQFISEELSRMARRGSEVAYVLDDRGHLVAHFDVSRALQVDAPNRRFDLEPGMSAEGARWRRTLEGSVVLTVWHRLDNPPWIIAVDSPWEQALSGVLETAYRALAFIAIAAFLALLVSRLLADRLVRPVMMLRKGAEVLGSGGLHHRIDLKTGDELEELGDKFNEMAGQLQEYTTGLERKVDERTAELRAAMRARALFLAAASHDLRQPLYAVSILTDTLALQPLTATATDIVAKQQQAVSILRGLFDNLLDLSRFEAGDVRPSIRTVALREMLMPLGGEFEVLCHSKALGWKSEIADAWVETDPELLRRLLSNLLSNAIRYTRAGSVSFIAKAHEREIEILIADTGIGIAPEDQERVFEEFVQLGNPNRERERGLGLGLSIVRKIDALLDTRMELRSTLGMGTQIILHLERAVAIAPSELPVDHTPLTVDEFAGIRMWVVEDDPMVRDALAVQFTAWNIDHDFAESRTEIESLRDSDGGWPDAIMLDDMLGGPENGLEIAQWLSGRMAPGRLMIVTGNVDAKRARELEQSGLAFARKPLSSIDLAQWLRSAARSPRSSPADAPAG